jgi:plasmid stabilization system protein ParE
MKVLVSRKAAGDLLQIYSYLAQRNPSAAEAQAQRIDGKSHEQPRFPFIGRERSSLGPDFAARLSALMLSSTQSGLTPSQSCGLSKAAGISMKNSGDDQFA